jgi:peptide/nickel transport system substrate-binding protein
MAVDNATVLKLGYNDAGTVGENHHVADPSGILRAAEGRDIEKAKALMTGPVDDTNSTHRMTPNT